MRKLYKLLGQGRYPRYVKTLSGEKCHCTNVCYLWVWRSSYHNSHHASETEQELLCWPMHYGNCDKPNSFLRVR